MSKEISIQKRTQERAQTARQTIVDAWGSEYKKFASTLTKTAADQVRKLVRAYKQPIALSRLNAVMFQ